MQVSVEELTFAQEPLVQGVYLMLYCTVLHICIWQCHGSFLRSLCIISSQSMPTCMCACIVCAYEYVSGYVLCKCACVSACITICVHFSLCVACMHAWMFSKGMWWRTKSPATVFVFYAWACSVIGTVCKKLITLFNTCRSSNKPL